MYAFQKRSQSISALQYHFIETRNFLQFLYNIEKLTTLSTHYAPPNFEKIDIIVRGKPQLNIISYLSKDTN